MIAVALTIGLAVAGYVATYVNGLRLGRRQERLSRVNRQLGEFYGPLFALTEANARIFRALMERTARADGRSPFAHDIPPTPDELAEWRLWVGAVFLPNIRAMRDVIVTKADLLEESEMPPVLLQMYAHVAGYELVVARWEQGDHSEHQSVVAFPGDEIAAYARAGFTRLKQEQAALLGRRRQG